MKPTPERMAVATAVIATTFGIFFAVLSFAYADRAAHLRQQLEVCSCR